MTSSSEEKKARALLLEKNAQLAQIIKPLPDRVYEVHCHLDGELANLHRMFAAWGGLNLTPDFQRGHVWTEQQQSCFIDAVLCGRVPLRSMPISFNVPQWELFDQYAGDLPKEAQCIDGLQRITALQKFVRGEIKAACGVSHDDLLGSSFQLYRHPFMVRVFAFTSKRALLDYYLALNTGGTIHSDSEIQRVTAMRDALTNP